METIWKRIGDEEINEGQQCVFAAIYCPNAQPYIDYQHLPEDQRNVNVPLILMQMRWDGYIGFPGGKVEKGESLVDALIRENSEEINYDISRFEIRHLCSHAGYKPLAEQPHLGIHCYSISVVEAEMRRILLCTQMDGKLLHRLSECCGTFAIHIANYSFVAFRKHNFKATSGLELDILVAREQWNV